MCCPKGYGFSTVLADLAILVINRLWFGFWYVFKKKPFSSSSYRTVNQQKGFRQNMFTVIQLWSEPGN